MESLRCHAPLLALTSLLAACGPDNAEPGSATEAAPGSATEATTHDTADEAGTPTGSEGSTAEPQVTTGECMGAPATSTAGEPANTEGLCPEHGAADACCCFADNGTYVLNACERRSPCQEIVLWRDEFADPDRIETHCPEAIDCALAALIDGEPANLRWRIRLSMGEEEGQIYVAGDGTGFEYHMYYYDLGCSVDPFVRRTLQTKAYFMECTARPSALDRFACVQQAFINDPIETCIDTLTCSAL